MQFADQPFYTKYTVLRGDTLFKIAQLRGFDNPGPIIAYPPNSLLFKRRNGESFMVRSADFRVNPGDVLSIPYQPDTLKKIIATSQNLAKDLKSDTQRLIAEQIHTKEDMDSLLVKIDIANFLANLAVSVGSLSIKYVASGSAGIGESEVVKWFVENRLTVVAPNIATLAIPAPTAPKRDYKWVTRHTLGPWNPSFWVNVYAACSTGDIDYYLYGSGYVADKAAYKIQHQAEMDVRQLENRSTAAQRQLQAPFYRHRI